MPHSGFAIEATALTKKFGQKVAVESLDLRIPTGSVFAFLGRNGSGKTTTIRMLLGFMKPTSGSSRVLGHDSSALTPALRGRVGYMSETHPLHDWMTVEQEVWFASQFHEKWNASLVQSILSDFKVAPDARTKELSRGERAGVSLAITLGSEPELLILDDPAAGLDPVARRSVLERAIASAQGSGRTVMLSSHQLDDVERYADCIGVLHYNRLSVTGSPAEVKAGVTRYRLTFAPGTMPAKVPEIAGVLTSKRVEDTLMLTATSGSAVRAAIASLGAIAVREIPALFEEAVMSHMGGGTEVQESIEPAALSAAGGAR